MSRAGPDYHAALQAFFASPDLGLQAATKVVKAESLHQFKALLKSCTAASDATKLRADTKIAELEANERKKKGFGVGTNSAQQQRLNFASSSSPRSEGGGHVERA